MTDRKPALRPRDIDRLNEARRVLEAIRERIAYSASTDETRLLVKVEDAQGAIFDVLNIAHAYCDIPVTEEEMHHWREDDVAHLGVRGSK